MTIEQHCKDCIEQLGESFEYVHQWLDEFMNHPQYKTRHRCVRHHLKGIEEVKKMWGEKAAMAAEIHIKADLKSDGWTHSNIPYDEKDYKESGLW